MVEAILTPTRTDEDKAIRRRLGDRGGIKFHHEAFNARGDHSNTLTSVQKDNLILQIWRKE